MNRSVTRNSNGHLKISQTAGEKAHACNPIYSGDRYGEDCSLRPAWAKELLKRPAPVGQPVILATG
jgi:hypothetical protein